jgi:hypothetical protein
MISVSQNTRHARMQKMAIRLVAAGNRELGQVLKVQKQLAAPAQRTADPC